MFEKNQVDSVICTVGTSLYSNLQNADPVKNPECSELKNAFINYKNAGKNRQKSFSLKKIADEMIKLPPDSRILGAEINSLIAMQKKGFVTEKPERIIFFVSDTQEGVDIGSLLKNYFAHKKSPLKCANIETVTIKGLQDADPLKFRTQGLSGIVRKMGEYYRKWSGSRLGINATGGYKAQIALAVAFGQVMHIPVFYMHERFNQIITFPTAPFTINLEPVREHLKAWADLADSDEKYFAIEELTKGFGGELPEEIIPLIEEIEVNSINKYKFSTLGLIYWEKFLEQYPDSMLPLDSVPNQLRQGVSFREDHYPKGFKDYVEKVYQKNNFIVSCHSKSYHNQQSITHGSFYEDAGSIIGEYADNNNFGAKFEIKTHASNHPERQWAVNKLKEWSEKQ